MSSSSLRKSWWCSSSRREISKGYNPWIRTLQTMRRKIPYRLWIRVLFLLYYWIRVLFRTWFFYFAYLQPIHTHDGSMVLGYMLTWLGYIDGIHVTIYSSTMDPSWDVNICLPQLSRLTEFEFDANCRKKIHNRISVRNPKLRSVRVKIMGQLTTETQSTLGFGFNPHKILSNNHENSLMTKIHWSPPSPTNSWCFFLWKNKSNPTIFCFNSYFSWSRYPLSKRKRLWGSFFGKVPPTYPKEYLVLGWPFFKKVHPFTKKAGPAGRSPRLTSAMFDPGTVPSLTQIIPAYNEARGRVRPGLVMWKTEVTIGKP